MKKIILSLCLVLFVSSAYAGSCPMMAKNIDDKIKKVITDIKLEEAALAHRQNTIEDAAPQVSVAT